MPIGYPGNSITKAARAKAGGGFESAISAVGSWTAGQPPVIESVSGTFEAGNQATLTVSNLSAKRSGQLYFENAEGFTVGADFFGGVLAGDQTTVPYVVSDDNPLFGTRFARRTAVQQSLTATRIVLPSALKDVFFEAWQRAVLTDFDSGGDEQLKGFRFFSDEDNVSPKPDLGYSFNAGGDQTVYCRQSGSPTACASLSSPGFGTRPADNQWERISMYLLYSDVGVANGKRYFKTSTDEEYTGSCYSGGHWASPNGTVAATAWDGEQIITDDGTGGSGTKEIWLPFYTRDDQTTTMDVDRLYVNDSPERVVVGDASTWLACDKRKAFILPTVSRSGSTLVFDIDTKGPLSTGPVYIYVFNRDGEYNSTGLEWVAP